MQLENKVAAVTGSSLGIGRAIAFGRKRASVAVYLASHASSYSTGSTFFVDGGMIRQAGSL